MRANDSSEPNALRSINNVTDYSCHVVNSTTHAGLTHRSIFQGDEHEAPCRFFSFLFTLGIWTLPAHAQTVSGTPADEQSIKALLASHAASAQEDDVDGMVATQHEDADERLDDGRLLVGRTGIAKCYQSIVPGGPHRLAHVHPTDSIRIRFLKPDVAFVDVAFVDVESASMSGSGPRTPYFLLFTKIDGEWGVAVVRSGASIEQGGRKANNSF